MNHPSTLYDPAVPPRKVLCVCLGNICRSPTAEAVLQQQVARAGLPIQIDSAGTSNYHPNKAPDPRSQRHAALRGIDLSGLRARQVVLSDFIEFDLILAMDRANLADLQRMQQQANQQEIQQAGQQYPTQRLAQLALMSQHDALWPQHDVPDPYYGEQADFERVLDQCDSAAQGWLRYWQALDRSR
ncbi:MAG: low molecular weight protein-tyrosine-phosphatase [Moraxellaceae bacterium]